MCLVVAVMKKDDPRSMMRGNNNGLQEERADPFMFIPILQKRKGFLYSTGLAFFNLILCCVFGLPVFSRRTIIVL